MDYPAQLSDIARKVLPIIEAANALSRDSELISLLRLHAGDDEVQESQSSTTRAESRTCSRRTRNSNPCTHCAASKQRCRYIHENPLLCLHCKENKLHCTRRERKRPQPMLDMSIVQAPNLSRQLSSMSQVGSVTSISSPSMPSSAVSQFAAYEGEMMMIPSAMSVTFGQQPLPSNGPSYALGVQPSNSPFAASKSELILPQGLGGNFALNHSQAPGEGDNLLDYFPRFDSH